MVAATSASRSRSLLQQVVAILILGTALAFWSLQPPRAPSPLEDSSPAASAATSSSAKVRIGWLHNLQTSGPRPPSGLTAQEAQSIATDNSGNLVWAYAARQLVDPNATEFVQLRQPAFSEPVHALLMPIANLLMSEAKYSIVQHRTQYLHNALKGVQAPIMLIGIGSQVRFEEAGSPTAGPAAAAAAEEDYAAGGAHVRLHPEQVAFLRRIRQSGGMMTVRGRFTAALVQGNGLPAPLPLGCPSFFLNHNPRLGTVLQQKWEAVVQRRDPKLRLAVNLPNIPGDKPYPLKLIELLAERILATFPNSVVVMQTAADDSILETMNRRHGLYLRSHRRRYYYDVQSWIDGLKACCDFVFGFRIHGTMAAVAAEVPGFLIAPDYRVKELAEAMELPSIDLDKVGLDPDNFDLFDFLASTPGYDGRRFDARRREAAEVYSREFKRLGVSLHPGVQRIANQPT